MKQISDNSSKVDKQEHIETLQDRITELQDEKKFMSVQAKQLRRKIREKSGDNTLKQQTIGNLESKQENFNQCIQEVIIKIKVLKQILRRVRHTIVIRMMKVQQNQKKV